MLKQKIVFFIKDLLIRWYAILCASIQELEQNKLSHNEQLFGVIISFCLPVINYISVNGKRKIKSMIGYVMTAFFVIVGFFSLSYAFYKIVVGDDQSRS